MSDNTPIPAVANFYVKLYHALPRVNVPFTSLNISFSLLGAFFLTIVRFSSENLLTNSFGWPEDSKPTHEAAACLTSICHSTILCSGLIVAFMHEKYDVAAKIKDQGASKKWWPHLADALLQFCTGYMIYDTCVGIMWLRWNSELGTIELTEDDKLYLVHHMMTTFYMTSCRIVGAGYMSAMICMLTGEITNPPMNFYLMFSLAMKLECCNGPLAQQFHYWNSIVFAASYFLVRVVIGPVFFACCTYVLCTKRGRTNIPFALSIVWILLIWGVVFGSTSWVVRSYQMLADFATGAQQEL